MADNEKHHEPTGHGRTLAEEIDTLFQSELHNFEGSFPTGNVWAIWTQVWNPNSNAGVNQLGFLQDMLNTFYGEVKKWHAEGRLAPYVLPMPGAWAMVPGFQACAAMWASTRSPGSSELPEAVRNYIRVVAQGLAATLGPGY